MPPVPYCKVAFLWEEAEQGWVDIFYASGADPRAVATGFSNQFLDLMLMPRNHLVDFVSVRASQVGAPRVTFTRVIEKGNIFTPDVSPDVTNTSALLKIYTNDGHTRNWMVSGLDDVMVARFRSGLSEKTPQLVDWVAELNNFLPNSNLWMQWVQPVTVNPWRAVIGFQRDPIFLARTRVNLEPGGLTPAVGDTVQFRFIDPVQMPGLRGNFNVVSAGAGQFVIDYRYRNQADIYFPPRGYWRKVVYAYSQLNNAKFVRWTTRDRGKPVIPHRGRRSAARLRF